MDSIFSYVMDILLLYSLLNAEGVILAVCLGFDGETVMIKDGDFRLQMKL